MKIIFLIAACLFSVFNTASSQYYNIIWEKSLAPDFGAPDEYIGTVLQFTCMNCLDKNNCIITGIVNKYPSIQVYRLISWDTGY